MANEAAFGVHYRMPKTRYSFTLRIPDRKQSAVPMKRIGKYIAEFAELLGDENKPRFKGIRNSSVGYAAEVARGREHYCHARIVEAKMKPTSKPGKHLLAIEEMMGEDAIAEAEILDANDRVIHLIFGIKPDLDSATERLFQESKVDGVVTGLVGVDDTMHLHLRDGFDRDLKLIVRDDALARELLARFKIGTVRLVARGTWVRTENGWSPEVNKCTVQSFEKLDDTPFSEVLERVACIPGNGWKELKDPIAAWDNIRGIH